MTTRARWKGWAVAALAALVAAIANAVSRMRAPGDSPLRDGAVDSMTRSERKTKKSTGASEETGIATAESHLKHGEALDSEGKHEEAVAEFRRAIEEDSVEVVERFAPLVGKEREGQLAECAAEFLGALQVDAETARRHHGVAVAMLEDRLDTAAARYWDARKEYPQYADALLALCETVDEQGLLDAAMQGLSIPPGPDAEGGSLHRNLAALLYAKGDYAEAWEQIHLAEKRGTPADPDFVSAMRRKMAEPQGSPRNEFTDLGVEAPAWQGAEPQEYAHVSRFRNAARRDASTANM